MSFCQHITTNYQNNLLTPPLDWPLSVRRTTNFIHENLYDRRLSVRWVKKKCRINGGSFATRFLQYHSYYPKEYILHHRKETAKQILRNTDVKVSLVAVSVGFNSVSAFCKTFKRKEGQTPSEWRSSTMEI